MKAIRSLDEFDRQYLPNSYWEFRMDRVDTPEEKGRIMAERTMEKIRPALEDYLKGIRD